MKVILQQDIRGKGKKGQMIEVAEGYARNYLLPHRMAIEATADNVNTMKMNDKAVAERRAKEKAEAIELQKMLKETVIAMKCKGGGAGRLFGSVTSQEIADAVKAQTGMTLDKKKIVIPEPIKTTGEHTVKCKLGYEINADLKLRVEEL